MSHFLAIIFYSRETWRSWKSWIIVLEKVLFGAPKILEFHTACPLGKQLSHFVCLWPLDFLLVLLMILLDSYPLGKWASKVTRSARKSTCPRLTDGIFFRPCYYAKLMLSRLLQISIYRLDDETNTVSQEIDLAILKALLKGVFSWVVPYFVWLHVLERELILYPVGFFADACEVLFLERRLEKEVRSRQRDSKTG